MVAGIVAGREARCVERDVRLAFARPEPGTAVVMGEEGRLSRVVENLIDNAISFSPNEGLVQISATRDGDRVQLRIDDEGRSEEHTSELQSLMRISYAVFCLKKKNKQQH